MYVINICTIYTQSLYIDNDEIIRMWHNPIAMTKLCTRCQQDLQINVVKIHNYIYKIRQFIRYVNSAVLAR